MIPNSGHPADYAFSNLKNRTSALEKKMTAATMLRHSRPTFQERLVCGKKIKIRGVFHMSEHHAPIGLEEKPVTTREILVYGSGTLCNSMIAATYNLLTPLMVLVLAMDPILVGVIIAIKTLWDGISDPIMASITDNARTRWGRRRPFILVGGVLTVLLCIATWTFIPTGDNVKPNVKEEVAIEQPAAEQPVMETVNAVAATETLDSAADSAPAEPVLAKEEAPAKSAVPVKAKKKSFRETMQEGSKVLSRSTADQKKTFYYLVVALLLLATTHTMFGVPFYALGIELSPTYHGRTRVVAYRSVYEKTIALLQPWYLPFCLMAVFANAIVGMKWLMILLACAALPSVIFAPVYTRERTHVDKSQKKVNMFVSIAKTLKNVHFLKVAALYIILQLTLSLFLQFGLYVNIFYVFAGDQETALKFGALIGAKVGTLAGILVIMAIPVVTWMCKRFQKHNTLRIALLLTATGCILNWFCYVPGHPNLQYILPFFYSLGISSTYTVLSTLMADVTDIDELNTGSRREGMFGAVMAWMMKTIGTIQAVAAMALLKATGFDQHMPAQTPETVLNMRLLFSFGGAALLGIGILLLHRYPLTRERMVEIKELIEQRKQAAAE
jgi:GPH family glycoside/pentoside/hexuronide:cation symporter